MKNIFVILFSLVISAAQAQVPGGGGAMVPNAPSPVPAGSSGALTTANGLYNLNSTNLLNWRKALAKMRAGTGRPKIVVIGDSTSDGSGAGSGGTLNLNGAYPKGWVPDMSALMTGNAGVPTGVFQTLWCDQAISAIVSYSTYDTRVALGANWSFNTSAMGGSLIKYTNGAVNNLTFTPTIPIDTVIVWYININTTTATVNFDGGASLGTINFSTSSTLASQTFSGALATHTINIVPGNTAAFFLMGITAYNSAAPGVDIIQIGSNGAMAATFGGTGGSSWQNSNPLSVLAPDLTIIDLTVNDSNAVTSLAAYQTSMQNIITAAKATGDVLLVAGPPSNTAQATNGTLAQFIAVNRSLAASNNVPFLDITTRWVSYAVTNPAMPYFDSLHPGAVAYQDYGLAVFEAISQP